MHLPQPPGGSILRAVLVAGFAYACAAPSSAQGGPLDPRVRWRVRMPGTAVTNFVATAPNGTVYVNNDDRLMALDPDGNLQWEVLNTSQKIARPIDVDVDGTIYIGGLGFGQVTALNPDGSVRWAFTPSTGDDLLAGPSLGPDGNIYAIADNLGTYSIDPTGNLRWIGDYESSTANNNTPIVFDADRFFVAINHYGGGPALHAFDSSDGREVWGVAGLGIPWRGHPVLDPSGRVIGPRWPTYVQAIQPEDGHVDWFAQHPGQVNFLLDRPQVDTNGVIYTSDLSGADLWAIDPDGSTRWFHAHDSGNHLSKLGVSPDDATIVAYGQEALPWLRGYAASDGALEWQIDLEPVNGVNQYMTSLAMVFTPDSRTAYAATNLLGTLNDFGYLYAIAVGEEVGTAFCSGEGSAPACPCGNASSTGGCANSTGHGGQLFGSGSASVLADDLTLQANGLPPHSFGLVFAGDATTSLPFGDGLRCVGGALQRFQVQNSGESGSMILSGIASSLGIAPGDTRYFQFWHRDAAGPCAGGFNATNALEVSFLP